MWCWRRLLRIPWTAHRTNQSILEELNIRDRLSLVCVRRILQFFGHTVRRDSTSFERLILLGGVEGTRGRGRIPMRWTDQVKLATGGTFREAVRWAEDRGSWRALTMAQGGHDPQN